MWMQVWLRAIQKFAIVLGSLLKNSQTKMEQNGSLQENYPRRNYSFYNVFVQKISNP